MVKTISICGAGWLGLPLARFLKEKAHTVKVSTTHSTKHAQLTEEGFESFQFSVHPDAQDSLPNSFFKSDILIITLPFKRSFLDPRDYVKQIKRILDTTPSNTYIIFTSSTSVYSKTNDWVTEESKISSPTLRQSVLLEVENLITSRNGTVLRLGGLYGPDRQIGGFLRHTKKPKAGLPPVNLVHLEDVIGVIVELIDIHFPGSIFNIVSDKHPTRRELYTHHASQQGFPVPEFDDTGENSFKIVSNQRLKDMLRYAFKHPDPMAV